MELTRLAIPNRRLPHPWYLTLTLLTFLIHANANGQTRIGLSLNVGDRQQYSSSAGFKKSLAPSGSLSISQMTNLSEHWKLRYGAVAGIVGYKLNVVMIDTLGPNGDVSPFPDYSTFFASAEILVGRQLPVFRRKLFIGVGAGITMYLTSPSTTIYSVEVILPDNSLVSVFDAEVTSPANRYSLFWKATAYYDINAIFSLGIEYIYHHAHAAEGAYIFHHTQTPHSGGIRIYQRELRLGIFCTLNARSKG